MSTVYEIFGNNPVCEYAYRKFDPAGGYDIVCSKIKNGTLFCSMCDDYRPEYDSSEETKKHIATVGKFISKLQNMLDERKYRHDGSKLKDPEKSIFDEYTPKLRGCTYGSEEYFNFLKEMQVALSHHYKENRHHPEHHPHGIKDMTLIDICEMLADWQAACFRHADGDIYKSIEINQKRFGFSDELKQIFINTVKECFDKSSRLFEE